MWIWKSGCINFNIIFWPFYTISIQTQGWRSMIFLLNIPVKYRCDDWTLDESSHWDLLPEWLVEGFELKVLDKVEFENLEVNIQLFYFGLTQILNRKNKGKMGSVLGVSQELPKNGNWSLSYRNLLLYESDINPELLERNRKNRFSFFSKKTHPINSLTATKT